MPNVNETENVVVTQPDRNEDRPETPIPTTPTQARRKPAKSKEVNYRTEYNKAMKEITELKKEIELLKNKCELLFNENNKIKHDARNIISKYDNTLEFLASSVSNAVKAAQLMTNR